MANTKQTSIGWFSAHSASGPLSETALLGWASEGATRAEALGGEAERSRLAAAGVAGAQHRRGLVRAARVTVGHGLVTVGEAIAGCRHALEGRAVRPVR